MWTYRASRSGVKAPSILPPGPENIAPWERMLAGCLVGSTAAMYTCRLRPIHALYGPGGSNLTICSYPYLLSLQGSTLMDFTQVPSFAPLTNLC